MTTIQVGDVVLVNFPFTDQSGSKARPAVAVWIQQHDCVLVAVTSNTIRIAQIQRVIRHLTEADLDHVKRTLRALFG